MDYTILQNKYFSPILIQYFISSLLEQEFTLDQAPSNFKKKKIESAYFWIFDK